MLEIVYSVISLSTVMLCVGIWISKRFREWLGVRLYIMVIMNLLLAVFAFAIGDTFWVMWIALAFYYRWLWKRIDTRLKESDGNSH